MEQVSVGIVDCRYTCGEHTGGVGIFVKIKKINTAVLVAE